MEHIGKRIYGFCNGFFGENYDDKTIEARGKDWIVARDDDDIPWFAEFSGYDESKIDNLIAEWSVNKS